MPLIWGGYQGDFSLRNTWPRGLCLVRFPHPWGKFSTLLQPFYNLPGWPGVLPQGQADDMCISLPGLERRVISFYLSYDKPCRELALGENCIKIISDKSNSLGMFLEIQTKLSGWGSKISWCRMDRDRSETVSFHSNRKTGFELI